MKYFRTYMFRLLALTIVIGILGAALFLSVLKPYYIPIFPWMLGLMAIITLIEHLIMTKSLSGRPNHFSQSFMIASALKLLLILVVMVIYLLIKKEYVIPFVAGIFVLYVFYSWFEVRILLKLVQGKHDN